MEKVNYMQELETTFYMLVQMVIDLMVEMEMINYMVAKELILY
jgi:hypothetical protein